MNFKFLPWIVCIFSLMLSVIALIVSFTGGINVSQTTSSDYIAVLVGILVLSVTVAVAYNIYSNLEAAKAIAKKTAMEEASKTAIDISKSVSKKIAKNVASNTASSEVSRIAIPIAERVAKNTSEEFSKKLMDEKLSKLAGILAFQNLKRAINIHISTRPKGIKADIAYIIKFLEHDKNEVIKYLKGNNAYDEFAEQMVECLYINVENDYKTPEKPESDNENDKI